ncbi:hypothetical protein C2S53_017804 [Perilla frutescens var. hirtella]|uniref:Receptor-like serine/threonine-protein kinase n=1 Tax=Perilla frutescens var. hirtella TaxID=608512 RepID=A0AAD4J3Y0_PERFH|nr:hypothetical protein C2S53_017804 [Perilla frutescens var. hirtella]
MFEITKFLQLCFRSILIITTLPLSRCLQTDTINATLILKDSETIHSAGNQFTLGFFTPNAAANRRYLGIWYNVSAASITWVANRETPLTDSRGSVSISSNGSLELKNGDGRVIWSSSGVRWSPPRNAAATLLDTGNLVLRDAATGNSLWESHRTPLDSFMPTMRVTHNPRTGERVDLNSWRAFDDPGRGNFTAGVYAVGVPQIYIWRNGASVWRSGPWNGRILTGVTGMYSVYVDGFSLGVEEDGTYYFTMNSRQSFVTRNFLNADGVLVEAGWDEERNDWNVRWMGPSHDCDFYNKCGSFAVCYDQNTPICRCLRGYEPREELEWGKGNWSGGCVKKSVLQCVRESNATDKKREDGFVKMSFIKVPDFMQWMSGLETECESLCLRNCSCLAYAYDPGIGCMFWSEPFIDVQRFPGNAGLDFYVRVAYSDVDKEKINIKVVIVLVVASLAAASVCLVFALWMWKRKGEHRSLSFEKGGNTPSNLSEIMLRSDVDKAKIEDQLPLHSFEMLATATNNFNTSNLLGMGGFGPVYKGKMVNGDEIAVKRLSEASGQGYEEFMNEVLVISKLQHRNLVRLLGCCVEKGEKMLIYEYMQNRSLDFFLFDKKHDVLDWRKRFNIMEGIGRGLLYLHRDSRLRIIHRDLKPSNVLLDEEWNPKISDFGMARIFGGNQDQANTGKVVGTYGYMAPEYAMGGRFSEKSDVFSFGVLVLEIISGRRNTSFYNEEFSVGLLGYAWKLWNEDSLEDFIDKGISSPSLEGDEIMRCLHIGLLCVQEFPTNRPNISTVLSMLSSEIVDLSAPEHPGFTDRWSRSSTQTPSANHITHTVMEGR